jgi:hypothetical protein
MADSPLNVTSQENVIPAADAEPSLSSVIESTLDKLTPASPAAGETPSSARGPEGDAAAPVAESGQPQRDAFGRFLPKKEGEAPAPAAAPAPAQGVGSPHEPAPVDEVKDAPASWTKEAAAEWAKVPEPLRPYFHQREKELQAGFQSVAARANVAEAVLNEFVPYTDILQKEGATPIMAMRTLLQTAHALRTGGPEYKKAVLISLAQQYGVDMGSGFNPELAKAQAENMTLFQERMYGQAQTTLQMTQQVEQQFNAFANNPANEFFPKVRTIMANLIGKGLAQDLPTAYDMALGMEPSVRKELVNREIKAREDNTRRNTASGMNVRGAVANGAMGKAADPGRSLRDTIAAQFGEE